MPPLAGCSGSPASACSPSSSCSRSRAGEGERFAWPAPDALFLFDRAGRVHRSADAGKTADLVGFVGGRPAGVAEHRGTLYVVTEDHQVRRSTDGARWTSAVALG